MLSNINLEENDMGVPFPSPSEYDFTFIDLFAGIGAFRLALQSVGGRCVFSSEWDKAALNRIIENYIQPADSLF